MTRKRKTRRKSPPAQGVNQSNHAKALSRRSALQNLAIFGIGGAALLGGAGLFAADFRAKMIEARLDDIGNGTPTVLQIHDPQCRLCAQLQKETRRALRDFDANDVQFRVANIRSIDGAQMAARFSVPHVTLVLLDGRGDVTHIVSGVTPAQELRQIFKRRLGLRPV